MAKEKKEKKGKKDKEEKEKKPKKPKKKHDGFFVILLLLGIAAVVLAYKYTTNMAPVNSGSDKVVIGAPITKESDEEESGSDAQENSEEEAVEETEENSEEEVVEETEENSEEEVTEAE